MSTLDAALAWAQRGFAVFPLRENTREPALKDIDWNTLATTDPEAIRRMWCDSVTGQSYNYNIGCACTGMVVIDIDVKKGKRGYDEYVEMGGTWDTLIVRTTTGGYHCYFEGFDSTNAPLSGGVDVRSNRGYVVAPGSTIDGVPYEVVNDVPMGWLPESIESRLQRPYVRPVEDREITQDTPAAIEGAIRFLESCPVAIEGQRGDDTTFKTAAYLVRERGLSETMAYHLLMEHWNPRCEPPWHPDDLWAKVLNGKNYGTAGLGQLLAEVVFKDTVVVPVPSVFAQVASWGNVIMAKDITPRRWIIDRLLMRRTVTMLFAPGSAGKSTLALAIAAHMAVGKEFAGFEMKQRCRTIIYNGEDDREEMSRRLWAVCESYGLNFHEVSEGLMLISNRDFKVQVVVKGDNGRPMVNQIIVDQLTDLAADPRVGCIMVDPLVKLHQCNEGDNVEMDMVVEVMADIAHKADIGMLAMHHTSKGSDRQENRVGNMDIGRGASAIVNAARIAFTLLNASEQDEMDYGIPPDEHGKWVRFDDAKMNLTLASDKATWFKREAYKIPSGDVVGVLRHRTLVKSKEHIEAALTRLIGGIMREKGGAELNAGVVYASVRSEIPVLRNKSQRDLSQYLEAIFTLPKQHGDNRIQAVREKDEKLIFRMV